MFQVKICEYCRKEWQPKNRYQATRNRTCSRQCAGATPRRRKTGERVQRVEVPCAHCQTLVHVRPKQITRNTATYCSRSCRAKAHAVHLIPHCENMKGRKRKDPRYGADNPSWNGGSYIEPDKGYRMIRMPSHPRARANGYVLEHILVAEQMLGRPLTNTEEVHHRNHDKLDNRPENLKVYADHLEHWMTEHYTDVANARDAASSKRNT